LLKGLFFFAEERDVTLLELIEFCDNQEKKIKAYELIPESRELIKENYKLMQLYSPSLSIQTKQSVDWTIKEFEYGFRKTETDGMMIQDGIHENSWTDLFQNFRRMCRDNKS